MHNQRGFIGIGVLIAILVGLAVFGGGAYYAVRQQAPSQTTSDNFDNVQQLPTTNNPAQTTTNTPTQTTQTTQTQNTQTQKATATIDKSSLTSNSSTPTISGTATSDIGIFIAKGKVAVTSPISTDSQNYAWRYWGHLGKCQSTTGDFCGFDILDGRWSTQVFGPGITLGDGTYTVIITDSIIGKDKANVLASDTLTINTDSQTSVTGLKTYTNTQYGFSIDFAKDDLAKTADYGSLHPFSSAPIVYSGHWITINASNNASDVANCTVPGAINNSKYSNSKVVSTYSKTINRVYFAVSDSENSDPSYERNYTTLHNGTCFDIQIITVPSCSLCTSGRPSLESYKPQLDAMDKIAQTFRFTQ